MEILLNIKALDKSYGDKKVINNISFELNKGEILCILGPNGAGKSTVINILCGVLPYESGEITYKGQDLKQNTRFLKKDLGIVPQDIVLYEDLTALDNIHFFASLYGLKKEELIKNCEWALSFVGLSDHQAEVVNTFSGGMKRRLNIACAIAHQPKIVIMDEPTVGIDPQSRNHILNSIKLLQEQGITIIYTTHYMEEVEEISTRIIIMDHGQIISEGSKDQLKKIVSDEKEIVIEVEAINTKIVDALYQIEGIKKVEVLKETITIHSLKEVENLDRIIKLFTEYDLKVENISCNQANLETVFLNMTGRSLRD